MTVADAVVRSATYGLVVIREEAPITLSHQSTSSHHSGIFIAASSCAALRLGAIGSKRGDSTMPCQLIQKVGLDIIAASWGAIPAWKPEASPPIFTVIHKTQEISEKSVCGSGAQTFGI